MGNINALQSLGIQKKLGRPKKYNLDVDKGLVDSDSLLLKKQRLLYLLRSQKASKGLRDLFFFAREILGYSEVTEQPHRELCKFLQSPYKKKLILEPRGAFKSSVGNISYAIWNILKNRNIRILIDSEDLANSKKFLSEIKSHFETNETFRSLYGDLVGDKWTESEILVRGRTISKKEPTIMCGGVETPRVGMHFDLIIADDLHSEHNVNTAEQIEKVIKHWQLNSSILEPTGEEVVIGTRWAIGDLYETIIKQEKDRRKLGLRRKYIVRKKRAEYSDGTLHFPTRLTREFLDEVKITQGSRIYALQYLNDPVDEDAVIFKPRWIQFYGKYPPTNLYRTVVLDPAISEKDEACNTAFTCVGTDDDGYMYILDALIFKCPPQDLVDWIIKLSDLWKPNIFGIESVAFQKAIKFWAWERMRQTGIFANIKELKTDTHVTKDMRIKALVPYVESGTLKFPGAGPSTLTSNVRALYEEMTQYPMCKTYDGIDSLAYHVQLYTPASRPKQKKILPTLSFQEIMKRERKKRVKRDKGQVPIIGRRQKPEQLIVRIG